MLIEDADRFSLIIPTYEGTPFLRRCLDYLRSSGYRGHIVLCDNSTAEHLELVKSCPNRYPELWLDVHLYDADARFLVKLVRTMERIHARYVMLCAQDDFIVADGVEQLVQALEADEGLSCARGRVARFGLRRSETGDGGHPALHLMQHAMLAYDDPDPIGRVLEHIRQYASTLYSVHRKAQLIQSFRLTEAGTRNVIFFQYLSSCITVALGRVACLDTPFLLRQMHSNSWAARLMDDYEHWPLLVASPKYSEYYLQFRKALVDFLVERLGHADDGSLAGKIDRAYVHMAKRSLCQTGLSGTPDDAFYARLQTAGTAEYKLLSSIAAFTLRYADTY
jgi:glycosyltransferase domain-containing protein